MKKKKVIIVTLILVFLLIYIIYVNIPKLFKTEKAQILIIDPPSLIDISLYSSGSGIFENIYQGNQPTHIMIYDNGIVVEKDYSTGNFRYLPDFLEKTENIKIITKISKEEVRQIKDKLIEKCEIYNADFGYGSSVESIFVYEEYKTHEKIRIKDNHNIYIFDKVAKEILENYDINIYLNNRY